VRCSRPNATPTGPAGSENQLLESPVIVAFATNSVILPVDVVSTSRYLFISGVMLPSPNGLNGTHPAMSPASRSSANCAAGSSSGVFGSSNRKPTL